MDAQDTLGNAELARRLKEGGDPSMDPRSAWHADMANRAHLVSTPLLSVYRGEEDRNSEASKHLPSEHGSAEYLGTHYANSAAEFGTRIEDGRLMRGSGVAHSTDRWDSSGAVTDGARALWAKDQEERLNFALDAAGGLYTSDPRAEVEQSVHTDEAGNEMAWRHNHSSLLGGADAAAAGTLKVRDGKVEELGDGSGHYQPKLAQTYQAVKTLTEGGAMEPERSSIRLVNKNPKVRAPSLQLSTTELMAYGPELEAELETAKAGGELDGSSKLERSIRGRHKQKDKTLEQLRRLGRKQDAKKIKGGEQVMLPSALPEFEKRRTRTARKKAFKHLGGKPKPVVQEAEPSVEAPSVPPEVAYGAAADGFSYGTADYSRADEAREAEQSVVPPSPYGAIHGADADGFFYGTADAAQADEEEEEDDVDADFDAEWSSADAEIDARYL
ncbi:MAG: hypothetical protein H6739_14220 [Alphaproteobacteria bacterium]|nr:hypothetical protein [Alphaproteobacteria bacterium]